MVASTPDQGGATSAALQWAIGLCRCGYDVVVVDPLERSDVPLGMTRAAAYLDALDLPSGVDVALLRPSSGEVHGMDRGDLFAALGRAEVLFDVSGMASLVELLTAIPVRIYIDLDPLFNQLWHEVDGIDMGFAHHTAHVTVGLCVGSEGCAVPTCGIDWLTSFPPVDVASWPVAGPLNTGALTTVGNWRSYGSAVDDDGVVYGQRAHSVRRLLDLPGLSARPVHAAMTVYPGDDDDRSSLADNGWHLVDPVDVAGDPSSYRRFVGSSWAELSIAKAGYVDSHSGWTSDRSACYLASGRPVVALDTGFSDHVPTGEGLLAFDDAEGAAAAVEAILADEPAHGRAARRLAEDLFDARLVVGRILDQTGAR